MSADIIPIIYSLRSKLNAGCPHTEQVDAIADAMQKLERIYADYDNLEIVKTMKQMLADQLLHDSIDVNIKNHLQMRGFEPIRRAVISTQIPASTGDVDLLQYQYAPTSNKKQKSGGYSMSFNFDDFPMFETVDSMLAGLRSDRTDRDSLNKILALDLSELVDHPQWEELLQTLSQSVSISGEHTTIVMAIYHRFVTGFKGSSQGLDALNASLMYLSTEWIPASTVPPTESRNATTTRQQVALFFTVLQASATSVQVPFQKEVDRAVLLVFLILSQGMVPTIASGTDVLELVTTIEALAGTKEQGASISALLRAIHPFTAFSYAVQTGLLRTLLNNATRLSLGTNCPANSYRIACICLRVLLSLLSNFGDNAARALEFVEHHLRTENGSVVFDAGVYEWQGHVSTLTDKLIVPIEYSNKRFLHISQAESLMPWFQNEPAPHDELTRGTPTFSAWIVDALAALSSQLHSVLASSTTITPSAATLLGAVLNLSLQVTSSLPRVDQSRIDSVVSAFSHMFDSLIRHTDSTSINDVLAGYMAGLATLLERAVALPAECVTQLLLRSILSPSGNITYASNTQGAFVRLLSAYVKCAGVTNNEHIVLIAQLCVDRLQSPIISDDSDVRCLLLQLLQTLCVHPAYYESLREHKLLLPSASALLSFLLNPDCAAQHTADANQRIARALLCVFGQCSETEIMECLLEDELLRVMEEEYLDADTWDRALDTESDSCRAFSAVFAVLLGVASMGHVNVLNAVLGESWGASIAAGGVDELADLTSLCVHLCLRNESALSLVFENIFPYIVCLLGNLQQNVAFCRSLVVLYEERKVSAAEYVSDAAGVDLVDVFISSTMSNIEALSAPHRQSTSRAVAIPRTELELQDVQQLICSRVSPG